MRSSHPQSVRLQACALAKALSDSLPADATVGRASALLAAECLEIAESAPGWLDTHAIVRDRGIVEDRERLLAATARLLLLASECVRTLGVHGGARGSGADIAGRTTEFIRAAQDSLGKMNLLEEELASRLEEPTVTERTLDARRQRLDADPSPQLARIKRLANEVARIEGRIIELENQEYTLDERRSLLFRRCADLEARIEGIRADQATLQSRHDEVLREISAREAERAALAESLEGAELRLREVRGQLESLRRDPRNLVRERVRRALQALESPIHDDARPREHPGA